MRSFFKYMSLFALFNFTLIQSSIPVYKVQSAKSKIKKMFPGRTIPRGMPEWVAVLDNNIHLVEKCLPTIKSGRCYTSKTCRVPGLKFDGRMIPLLLKFCKDPFQIVIHFLSLKIPWWAKVDLKPVIINFRHHDSDGVFTITSSTTITARVKFIRLRVARARFYVDGLLRYDCTKPRNDWKKRVAYNFKAPNKQYTSIFYKLKMRIEIKTKCFCGFKFKWKCRKCEDIVNESGTLGNGPRSCAADMQRHKVCGRCGRCKRRFFRRRRCRRYYRCIRRLPKYC